MTSPCNHLRLGLSSISPESNSSMSQRTGTIRKSVNSRCRHLLLSVQLKRRRTRKTSPSILQPRSSRFRVSLELTEAILVQIKILLEPEISTFRSLVWQAFDHKDIRKLPSRRRLCFPPKETKVQGIPFKTNRVKINRENVIISRSDRQPQEHNRSCPRTNPTLWGVR